MTDETNKKSKSFSIPQVAQELKKIGVIDGFESVDDSMAVTSSDNGTVAVIFIPKSGPEVIIYQELLSPQGRGNKTPVILGGDTLS